MTAKIWSLAKLVILDGIRRYGLMGLVLLALGLQVAGLFFFNFIPRDIGRASTDFILSIGWFTGFIFLLIHAVQVVAWNEERRTIHTFLARPISRTLYVLGNFFGLSLLLLLLNIILSVIGYGILLLIKDSVKAVYFPHFFLEYYLLSWWGIFSVELMILSVVMVFSGIIRGSFPVFLLSITYYFICTGLPVVRQAFAQPTGEETSVLQGLLRVLNLIFPDFTRFDFKTLVTTTELVVPLPQVLVDSGVMSLYVVIMLWLASLVYEKRDLQ